VIAFIRGLFTRKDINPIPWPHKGCAWARNVKQAIEVMQRHPSNHMETLRRIICGWCRNETFIWTTAAEMIPPATRRSPSDASPCAPHSNRLFRPIYNGSGDTICIHCDMGIREWYAPWHLFAWYRDGCTASYDASGGPLYWRGGKHAPHNAFEQDAPIYIMERTVIPISPIIDKHHNECEASHD